MMWRRSVVQAVVLGALSISLFRCAVGPDFVRPDAPAVQRFTPEKEGGSAPTAEKSKVSERWWQLLHSPQLDQVVEQAMTGNYTLQAALARLRQSEKTLKAGYGVFYPQVDGSFDATRQKSNPQSFGGNFPATIFSLFTLSGTVTYALDIFGGARRAAEGLKAQVEFQRYTAAAAYLTLTSNLVNTLIARAAYQAQVDATMDLVRAQKEEIEITRAQVKAGTTSYSGLLSIEGQLYATEASLAPLQLKLDQTNHLLASLVGKTPSEWTAPGILLSELTLPPDLPLSLPSELVRQRPDILASEAELHYSCAQVGVATANLYPSFNLNATYGQNNRSLGNLFRGGSNFWGLGAGIAAPIFHGGTLRAEKEAAVEAYKASAADYQQTVLNAFTQVADTLRGLEHDREALEAQSKSQAATGEALKLVRVNYRSGVANYIQVLTANAQYLQSRVSYTQAVAQRLQDGVALYVALGGGWWESKRFP